MIWILVTLWFFGPGELRENCGRTAGGLWESEVLEPNSETKVKQGSIIYMYIIVYVCLLFTYRGPH
jgi:hypothetical protein